MVNHKFFLGLPTVQHALMTPVRYASPPLPQIRTSIYEDNIVDDKAVTHHNSGYPACQNEEVSASTSCSPRNQNLLSVEYQSNAVDLDKPQLVRV